MDKHLKSLEREEKELEIMNRNRVMSVESFRLFFFIGILILFLSALLGNLLMLVVGAYEVVLTLGIRISEL